MKKGPKISLCKIDTERVWYLSPKALKKGYFSTARFSPGGYSSNPGSPGSARFLLSTFLRYVREWRLWKTEATLTPQLAPKLNKLAEAKLRRAREAEIAIWDAQQLAKCKIKPGELVARDAYRQGLPLDVVQAARGRRRAKIR